jgi:hypothetical protein
MEAPRCFTGRKEHRRGGLVYFAEVTVQAEPCLGESEVVLSQEVLDTLREVFGTDFEPQRHCVWSAVSAQLSTINTAGDYPHAEATSFRAEVVGVRVSGNAGRQVSGFLLSVAGMDAIAGYLTAWEHEQEPRTSGVLSAPNAPVDSDPGAALQPEDDLRCVVHQNTQVRAGNDVTCGLTEDDYRCAVYQTTYVGARNDINGGLTEDDIRGRYVRVIQAAGRHADVAREAVDDALAGLPMRYESRVQAKSLNCSGRGQAGAGR